MSAGEPAALRAVLFDAVGTLIELREPVGESYARLARAHDMTFAAEDLERAFARIWRRTPPMPAGADAAAERGWWRQIVWQCFREADPQQPFHGFEGCFEAFWRHFAGADGWQRRAGSLELLIGLRRRGLATAVVSNFDRRLRGLLGELGLVAHLDTLVLPAEAGAAKPDPRIFALALERLGVPARAALFVGDDDELDLGGARRAGIRSVAVQRLATLEALSEEIR